MPPHSDVPPGQEHVPVQTIVVVHALPQLAQLDVVPSVVSQPSRSGVAVLQLPKPDTQPV